MSEQYPNLENENADQIIGLVRRWANTYSWRSESKITALIMDSKLFPDGIRIDDVDVNQLDEGAWEFNFQAIIHDADYSDHVIDNNAVHFTATGVMVFDEDINSWAVDDLLISSVMTEEEIFSLASDDSVGVSDDTLKTTGDDPATFTFPEKRLVSANEALLYISVFPNNLWYRGHANEEWKLETGIAREDNSSPALEKTLRLAFENQTAFLDSVYHPPDTAKRIFLMQHHGLPTRLLDWTTSPLTALYFAVCHAMPAGKDADACIWAMDPAQLNAQQKAGFPRELKESQDEIFTEESENKVLAIHAPHVNWRMKMQQAEFTLHSDYKPLEEMPGAPVYLREKIIIPKGIKAELRGRLTVLGVTRAALFPELDYIAQTIKDDILEKPDAADSSAMKNKEDANNPTDTNKEGGE